MNELINEQREQIAQLTAELAALCTFRDEVVSVMNNSEGVVGWHKNHTIATWDELFPVVPDVKSPQHYLAEIRAQAIDSFKDEVINELEETVLVAYSGCRGTDASDLDDVKVIRAEKFEKFADQYADSIRQEGK